MVLHRLKRRLEHLCFTQCVVMCLHIDGYIEQAPI